MESSKIGKVGAIALITIVMTNHIILNLPKSILNTTGSASIINVIYISIIMLILGILIVKLFEKFNSSDIFDVSEYLGGKWLKIVVCILYIAYGLYISSILVRSFSESLKIIYFPGTPITGIIMFFIIGLIISVSTSFKSIVKANLILTIIVLTSILILFFSVMNQFELNRIFPILGYGANETFISGFTNIYAFSGILFLFLIPPILKNKKDFKKIVISSIIISAIYLVISVSTLLFMFPSILSIEEILPIYLTTRSIEFSRFFQRADALFVLTWILANFSYLSIMLSYISHIFKKSTNIENPNIMIYSFASILLGLSLVPKGLAELRILENIAYKYAFIISLVFSSLILVLANLKHKHNKKKVIQK